MLSVPVTPLTVAVIWAVPAATPVTSPDGPTLATVLSELIQVALALALTMLPSDNVAIAESWSVSPVATEVLPPVIAIDTTLAAEATGLIMPLKAAIISTVAIIGISSLSMLSILTSLWQQPWPTVILRC
jgi:hypothetical protein